MRRQISRLVDHGVTQPALGQDLAGPVAAPAGIEIVAMEIEHHDTGAPHLLEQRIELGRVEPPAVIELVEAAVRGRRGRDDRVDLRRGVRRHQRQKGAKRLSGEDDLLVAFLL